MWLEAGLAGQVEEFWELAGEVEPFPRRLANSACLALPVAVRELPRLSMDDVRQWLVSRHIPHELEGANRRLRGCLLAYAGHAFVLVDGSDPDDEKRFTIAHGISHFLLDYREPRRRAIMALGKHIIPVLDGLRPPTRTERLQAILSTMSLGLHVDLMERTTTGGYTSHATLYAEDRADRLALELLSPAAGVWADLSEGGGRKAEGGKQKAEGSPDSEGYRELGKRAVRMLCGRYGLPEEQARAYAAWLLKKAGLSTRFRDWLGVEIEK